MRSVVFGALVWTLVSSGGGARAAPPAQIPRIASCEEECRVQASTADLQCDVRVLCETDRDFCHQIADARLDVCLRICGD